MMIDKRLVGMVPDSKKYIAGNVVLMWCSLVANIVMMSGIALLLQKLFFKTADSRDIVLFAGLVAAVNVALLQYRGGHTGLGDVCSSSFCLRISFSRCGSLAASSTLR